MYKVILKSAIVAAILFLNNFQCFAYISGYVLDPFGSLWNGITVKDWGNNISWTSGNNGTGYYQLLSADGVTLVFAPLASYGYLWSPASYNVINYDNVTNYGGYNFTRVNRAPGLAWTGEAGYEADGIEPNIGGGNTTFTFRIQYTDADNDVPQSGYPRVVIKKGASTALVLPMNYISGGYTTGAIYSTATLLAPCSYYTYTFETSDIWNGSPAPVTLSGPNMLANVLGMVRDVDGSPMGGITLSLTGNILASTKTAADGTYTFALLPIGESYTVTPSSHPYYSFTPVSRSTALIDNLTNWDLARNNTAPTLSWPGEANYYGIRGVWPSTGTTNSDIFIFRTVFTDADDDGYKSVELYVKKGGVVISTIPLSDCYGSYHSGLTCSYATLISTSGFYSYRFGAVGRWNETIATPELTFLSMIAPTVPVNDGTAITDNQSFVSAEVTLKWGATDPEGGPLTYDVYVSPAASQVLNVKKIAGYQPAASAAVLVYSGPNTSYILRNLSPGRTYYWKVNATNQYGVTTQGTVMNFLTLDLPIDKMFNYPNPFNPARQQTNIVFSVAAPQTVKVRIYSEYGDLLRTLETRASAGTNELKSDGRDKNGKPLYNGSYIAMIERTEGTAKCYLLIVK